ncbi:hypothetical protein GCM10010428_63750 [Actinosynnema pretiosum subsp. pretiosum]
MRHTATRYRDWAFDHPAVRHLVFFETWKTKGVQVVAAGSADPRLPKVAPVPVDADHAGVCKPEDRGALVYARTRDFVAETRAGVRPIGADGSGRTELPRKAPPQPGTPLSGLARIHLLNGRHVIGSLGGQQPSMSVGEQRPLGAVTVHHRPGLPLRVPRRAVVHP